MAASDDDDELQRAIALSLQGPASDDESRYDRDTRLAMALSLEESRAEPHAEPPQYATTVAPTNEKSTQRQTDVQGPSSAFALNRKVMEQERLERLRKRKRSPSPERPSKQPTSALDSLQYPKGAVKRTWAYKHARTDADISLEEVLQASTLNIAVLSSFQWDDRFIFHKADPKKVKHYWIIGAKGDEREKVLQELAECNIPNLKPHFPPMEGTAQTMHSKLMLLFHKTHLRIVIPTANMMKVEWGETGQDPKTPGSWQPAVLENTLFLIDLPRRSEESGVNMLETAFGQELCSFLEAQIVSKNVLDGLHKFDFSETDRLAFVHSIAGSHSTGPLRDQTGLPGLARAIRKLGLDDVECLELDFASSSLGSMDEGFLQQIYLAASGLQPLLAKAAAPQGWLDRFRIYFPTHETVVNSTGGIDCGGVITLDRKRYQDTRFPRQCLRNHVSTRPGLLSHNKLLLARGYKKDGSPFAWAYVGSANATSSAWGSQQLLKSGKEGALRVRNWECGVIVPVSEEKLQEQGLSAGAVPPMSVFHGTVEVPFQFPGELYDDGKKPWFFLDNSPKD